MREHPDATLIHSARLVADGTSTPDTWVRFAHGTVTAIGTGDSWMASSESSEVIDAREIAGEGAILTAGFVDIHCHGGGSASFEGDDDDIRRARTLHRAHGTTRQVLSLVSAPLGNLAAQVARIARLSESDADILGSHLEGPFLDPGHKGAHDPRALTEPAPDALAALVEAGGDTIRQITLAPELPGGTDAVRALAEAGIRVAVGHTDADLRTTAAAFDAGASILTHAFNAMPGLHHREPGPLGAALADPDVTIEVIADGVHVHPELIRVLFAAAPERVALVTDAMAAAGAGDGHYLLGDLSVDVIDGVARLRDGGAIAGSTLTQDAALRQVVSAGVDLPAAVQALTTTPARAIGRPDLGTLTVGSPADAVLLSADLEVRQVWFEGLPATPADVGPARGAN
ncbi:N-acetylglucosamine-6-phosphate deacetylase [Microbacterium sediminicola]|uniref:N-acetylglucosamine-6-phosphate deacetylase n=1 Tax=Microbacterium sediminicola TaxID=415210 RepID=A0ABP4TK13_9MICO